MAVAAEALVRDKLYIGGEWVEPAGDGTIEVVNPSTEEAIGRIPEGTPEDADRAVEGRARCLRLLVETTPARARGAARGVGASWTSAATSSPR